MPKQPLPRYLVISCQSCTWARSYKGAAETLPSVPHARHFMDTGHDRIRVTPSYRMQCKKALTAAELKEARVFSAGCQYGAVYAGAQLRKHILAVLPPAEKVDPKRARDQVSLAAVEEHKVQS